MLQPRCEPSEFATAVAHRNISVEQVTKFGRVINLPTGKALGGLAVPGTALARADGGIEEHPIVSCSANWRLLQ